MVEASENDITLIMWLRPWDSCSCDDFRNTSVKLQGAHFPPTLSDLSYSCSLVWSYLCFGRVTDILILLFRHICSKKHNFFFVSVKFSTEFLIQMFVRYITIFYLCGNAETPFSLRITYPRVMCSTPDESIVSGE